MIARRREPRRRTPYQIGCAVGAWLFLLAAVAFALSGCTAHDGGDVVGAIAGVAVALTGAAACAHSARHG
ncbi:membrane protein [Mycobacterium phage Funsized]|nr:membrane protein [Mycobacterium phage Funsized]